MTQQRGRSTPVHAEIARLPFVKSTFSGGQGACVGIKRLGDYTVVGKQELGENSPLLTFPSADWDAFCGQITQGIHTSVGEVQATFTPDGGFSLTETTNAQAPVIAYTHEEWEAFRLGVHAGELRSAVLT